MEENTGKRKLFEEDGFDMDFLNSILNQQETVGDSDKDEWESMEDFLQKEGEKLTKEQNTTWQELYEQAYCALFDKYNVLGLNERSIRNEYLNLKEEDSKEKWWRGKPFHEHFSIILSHKLSRIFFVRDTDDPLEIKNKEACDMFPYKKSDLLDSMRGWRGDKYDVINELQLMVDPLLHYRENRGIPRYEETSYIEFIRYILGLLKDNEEIIGGHVVPRIKDIMKIYKITITNLLECRKVVDEFRDSRLGSDEVYYYEKKRLSSLESNMWYVYLALHVYNLTMIGFLDIENVSKIGKLIIWKYINRLTSSILQEISLFRVPLETDIPKEKRDNISFTGNLDNDLWAVSFNRFWRLELLDYTLEWIRRLKKQQKWNIPSLKFLREVIIVERKKNQK